MDAVGYMGCALAVAMMSSPLATMRTIVAERRTDSMPLPMTIATFGNALSWTAYGAIVAHNPIVWAPNGLGLVAATAQFGLYAVYGLPGTKGLPTATDETGEKKQG